MSSTSEVTDNLLNKMKATGLISSRIIGINMTTSSININIGGYNSSAINITGNIYWIKLNSDG